MKGGGIVSRYGLAVENDWSEAGATTIRTTPLDKVDVTAYGGDVLMQYLVEGSWEPSTGVSCRKDVFRSIPGLASVYTPGPLGVRFKRAVAGVAATVDFDGYSP